MDKTFFEAESAASSFSEAQLAAVLSSPEGKALIALLGRDGGAAIRAAADAFRRGDAQRAKELLSPIMQEPQAQALVEKINRQV